MKKLLMFAAIAVAFIGTASAQKESNQNESSAVKWEQKAHDFGNLEMGPPADVVFKFRNMGKAPVVITGAKPSCGCTTPSWTKTPIMPGQTGEVKASYGTEGRPGYFQKTVKVTFDNGDATDLTISGTVNTDTKPESK
jgi:hypothetical protein